MENINSNMNKNDNSYVLSALSYLSIFFAPVILPLLVCILADEPTSRHGKKALVNHALTWISFFIGRAAIIFSKEIFDKPLNHQLLIFIIALVIAIIFFLIALILYILNIIRGIKILLKK
ncbi:hypothetical protein [Staphylococcus saccharolyticus]|uniref:DUF4870 domain-containing protein n=1 Tax=Staphylococcus saccharolyticus TaxID=33028 RepID=A0A380GX50_9STAP|nr:hypothetical protein [Staphylococcus saccharolyticus]MBL7564497.1 hypothetical protein [Staphylococcus saccharolyticus]MBL7571239.1 hypothetical protein [Staphylococcus saccharolyticus]QQB99074.1 hypothetical protein I6I31_04150 [Staphylococcus saccharolyticus]QRJ66712.1 hypothetical protein DMB76_000200 [Staphylococcus saccharolyticus]RTX94200.1 hypothetical protein CD145_09485 [Staphylococcus saccharolyticus]